MGCRLFRPSRCAVPLALHNRPVARARKPPEAAPAMAEEAGLKRMKSSTSSAESPRPPNPHFLGTSIVPGLSFNDLEWNVPLDYSNEEGGTVRIFARLVVAPSKAQQALPYLLFLQGGPGHESPRPTDGNSGWLKAAVAHFRVLLLDQRGTGLSSAITPRFLTSLGDAQAQADYLSHFRADNIVRDAELIRHTLVPAEAGIGLGGRWSVLGQSFGGFTAVTYLSMAPQGLAEVLLTGGLPPGITSPCSAVAAYRSLYRRVMVQNSKFYERFPRDIPAVHAIVHHLAHRGGVDLPSGGRLSVAGLQSLGLVGLGTAGGFERLHYLLERAWDGPELSLTFLKGYEAWSTWDTNPLYALLHEAIYCQGGEAAAWAAARVRAEPDFAPVFDAEAAAAEGRPVCFTGEMVYPWLFQEVAALRPLESAAHALAERAEWPQLYDAAVLARNTVPVASATYYDDIYVDFALAQETAGHIRGIRQWVTNEYMHSGIRDDGARIFDQLLSITRGTTPLF